MPFRLADCHTAWAAVVRTDSTAFSNLCTRNQRQLSPAHRL
jgi:hypothetical protein